MFECVGERSSSWGSRGGRGKLKGITVSQHHVPPQELARTTTTATAATARTILALDRGKYKTVACLYQRDTAQHRFQTVDTCRDDLRQLLLQQGPDLVVFEACALAGWVHDLCVELGRPCKVANTASEAWKYKHTKRKTDKDDALRLAQLEALGQLPTVTVRDKATREWRGLIASRQDLIGRRVALQNRLRALLVGQGLPAPRGHRAWTEAGLPAIAQHARPLAECGPDELWRGLLELALTEYRQVLALLEQVQTRLDAMAQADAACVFCSRSPASAHARPRWSSPTSVSPSVFRRPSRSVPRPDWCRASTSRATATGAAASPAVGRRC
jgi:hypothetical protein